MSSMTLDSDYTPFSDIEMESSPPSLPSCDYKMVRRMEAEERSRRIEDIYGESIRKANAQKVSKMFAFSSHPEASAYLSEILGLARQTGHNLLKYSQTKASQMTADFSEFTRKKGYKASESLQENFDIASQKGIQTVYALKDATTQKAFQMTSAVSDKTGEKTYGVSTSLRDKLDGALNSLGVTTNHRAQKASAKASELSQTAMAAAKEQLDNASTVAHQASTKARSLSISLLEKVNQSLSHNTDMAYISLQENTERAYRLSSDNASYAILNGLMVSNLIKDLGCEYYRPASEPSRLYSTRLLEQYERSSRISRDITGIAANKSRMVSKLIKEKFSGSTSTATYTSKGTTTAYGAKLEIADGYSSPVLIPLGASM